jgi:hypothetical protein
MPNHLPKLILTPDFEALRQQDPLKDETLDGGGLPTVSDVWLIGA